MTRLWISRDKRKGSPPYFLWTLTNEPILDKPTGFYHSKRKNGGFLDLLTLHDWRTYFPDAPRLKKGEKMKIEVSIQAIKEKP